MGFEEIVVKVVADVKNAMEGLSALKTTVKKVNVEVVKLRAVAEGAFKEMQARNKQTAQSGQLIVQRLKEQAAATKKVVQEQRRFKGELLSMLFFYMALQRAAAGFITAAFQTFNKVTEGTSLANNGVNRLKAAWEFLKFSMVDALMKSGFFNWMILGLIRVIDLIAGAPPWVKTLILVLLGVVVVVSSIGMILAIWGLYFDTAKLGAATLIAQFKTMKGAVLALVAALKDKLIPALASTKASAKLGLVPILGWLGGLLAVLAVATLLKDKFGSWQDAFKAWASAIALAFSLIIDFILNGFITVLKTITTGLAWIVSILATIANFVGAPDWITSGLNAAARKIGQFQQNVLKQSNLTGELAAFLDEKGFNPQPVDRGATNNLIVNNENNIVVESTEDVGGEAINETINSLNDGLTRLGLGEYKLSGE